jgi:hypothetical protein
MSQSVTVAATITKIRQRADIETTDVANSVVTDTELVSVVNDAYRMLFDLIAGRAGIEYFATSATVSAATFALPADFYQALGVDLPNFWGSGQPYSLKRFTFAERNRRTNVLLATGYDVPTYRIQNGYIKWEPASAAPTDNVTLWYVPTPAALASNGSFDAVNGWDDYVVARGVLYCKDKQEEDNQSALLHVVEAEKRVRENASRIVRDPVSVADLRDGCALDYFNS